ncbi:MAG: hypothetical protein E6076_07185 [Peptoniphilus harei]|uniref:hypothetical protein n=1 Tax=Peptoniphilus harei TaxID=54005 RepID=UPI00290FFC19|nr:hypothetical protein [Peptoniphilus harei]MDU5471607.1 hypothetical protein [Peptoniphilus harei]MDU6098116.1 hypothetical protein [Peptoniphilus harei]
MAVFDTGPGIVGLYEVHRDYLNYYVDDKFEYYGLYRREVVDERIKFLEKSFKKAKKIIVMDFDAINYFKNSPKAFYGQEVLMKKLKNKKILCLGSMLTCKEETLKNFTDSPVDYLDVPLLINGANDGIADDIMKMISDEYFKDFDFSKYNMIFLASSGLHLKKDFFINYFSKKILEIEIYSNVDGILEDYTYKKENYIRDYFYVTESKRAFYSRAEKYLREKGILKERELLNVSRLFKKGQ